MRDDENIDKIFESLKDSDQATKASPDWNTMKSMLAAEGLPIEKKKKRRVAGWIIGIGITALSVAGGSYFYFAEDNSKQAMVRVDQEVEDERPVIDNESIDNKSSIDTTPVSENGLNETESSEEGDTNGEQDTNNKKSNSGEKIYRVQIGAYVDQPSVDKYENVPDLIIEQPSRDDYTRYYAGEFNTKQEAEKRLAEVRAQGYRAFVVSPGSTGNYSTRNLASSSTQPANVEQMSSPSAILDDHSTSGDQPVTNVGKGEDAESSQDDISSNKNSSDQPEDNNTSEASAIDEDSDGVAVTEDAPGEERGVATMDSTDTEESDGEDIVEEPVDSTDLPEEIAKLEDSDTPEEQTCPKWAIGGHISKDFNSHKLKSNILETWVEDLENNYDQFYRSKNQFSLGISAHYRLSCKLTLSTGVTFAKKGLFGGSLPDTSRGVVSPNYVMFEFSGTYLDVPLTAQYYFFNNNKNLKAYAGGGVVFNINSPLYKSTYEERGTDDILYRITLEPTSFNMSAVGKLGLEYKLTDKLYGYVEPRFQYGLTPIVRHPSYQMPFDQFIRTFGIGLGVTYDLK